MEWQNEDVAFGKLLDENSYKRDEKHINIDNVINIDFIRAKDILHEVKKSNKIEKASVWQVKYYLYYLHQREVTNISAKIDYPLLKQSITVELNDEDFPIIENVLTDILDYAASEQTPPKEETAICKKCAYHDLCYI